LNPVDAVRDFVYHRIFPFLSEMIDETQQVSARWQACEMSGSFAEIRASHPLEDPAGAVLVRTRGRSKGERSLQPLGYPVWAALSHPACHAVAERVADPDEPVPARRGLCTPNQIRRKEGAKNPSRLQIDALHRAWLCSSPACRFELAIFFNGASGLKAGGDTGLIGMVSLLQKERRLSNRCPNQEKAV
jgi:hypothetical protein